MRKIVHVDMDAFFASIEQRDHPHLRGQPVAVGGNPNGRGVVAAASYEARRFGVKSAMSSAKALRRCPSLHFVSSHFEKYQATSREIRAIFNQVTEIIEPLSLDEAYLDVTENKLGLQSALEVARWIQREVWKQTQLTCSVGISHLKFLAKIASDLRKPNGITCIRPEAANDLINTLPIERFWGVGPATTKHLHSLGIFLGRDLKSWDRSVLVSRLGKFGGFLHDLANGIDPREVKARSRRKSVGSETTFTKDIQTIEDLSESLLKKATQLCDHLKDAAQTVQIKIRFKDFKTMTRSRTLIHPTKDSSLVFKIANELLKEALGEEFHPVRLIGLSLSQFGDQKQLTFPFIDPVSPSST